MGVRNEGSSGRRSTDLMTTLMTGLDENERRDTIDTIQRRITEDREAAYKARNDQNSDGR